MSWNGQKYVDTLLPFGLKTAPIIFTAVADALQWVIETHVECKIHIKLYLDNYLLLLCPPKSLKLQNNLFKCQNLRVSGANLKTEGQRKAT